MVKVKICGIQQLSDIEYINEIRPDYIGFVFAPSKRRITPKKAHDLIQHVSSSTCVGVFVNEDIDNVVKIVQTCPLDIVQLHGDEDASYIKQLKSKITIPIWKAIRLRSVEDIQQLHNEDVEHFLIDAYSDEVYGGSGKQFNRELLENVNVSNYVLAGGISIENVDEILQFHPYGIDVSSSLETNGIKDKKKIEAFMAHIENSRGEL